MLRTVIGMLAFAGLASCSLLGGRAPAPIELYVEPAQPLVIPATNALPAPTPGGVNPASPNPEPRALAGLGGPVMPPPRR